MKVCELIEELKKLPEDTRVFVRDDEGLGIPVLTYAGHNLIIEAQDD